MYATLSNGLVPPAPPAGGRAIPAVSKGHFTGLLVIGDEDGEGQKHAVESHLEMQVALIVRARRGVINLATQAPFHWVDANGEVRTHYFDLKAYHDDGSRTAIMVKPEYRRQSSNFAAEARQIAAQVTQDFAERVCVFSEASIDPIELHNAELRYAWRRPAPEADAAARRAVNGLTAAATLRDLVAEIGLGPCGLHALVRLIDKDRLRLVDHVRIDGDALVTAGRA